MKLKGKVAVVTGAGRGLGRAISIAMAKEGARIALISRTREEILETSALIRGLGQESLVFPGDVSREDHVEGLVQKTVERFSRIDILVNNAAVIGPPRFLEDADPAAWMKTMDINLNSAFLCVRATVSIMDRTGGGKIINISSGLGQMPFPRFCAYAVSKAGIIQLTRSLSEELKGRNIRVNAIDPGVMDTPMQEKIRSLGQPVLGKEIYDRFVGFKKEGHLKNPERVAALAVFLASRDSDRLSGYYGTLDEYMELGWHPQT